MNKLRVAVVFLILFVCLFFMAIKEFYLLSNNDEEILNRPLFLSQISGSVLESQKLGEPSDVFARLMVSEINNRHGADLISLEIRDSYFLVKSFGFSSAKECVSTVSRLANNDRHLASIIDVNGFEFSKKDARNNLAELCQDHRNITGKYCNHGIEKCN